MTVARSITNAAPANQADYDLDAPDGVWTGRLDYLRWGKASNLLGYFTEVGSGRKYFFSFFAQDGYGPRDRSMSFRDATPGALYRIETARTTRGMPKCLTAAPWAAPVDLARAFLAAA